MLNDFGCFVLNGFGCVISVICALESLDSYPRPYVGKLVVAFKLSAVHNTEP